MSRRSSSGDLWAKVSFHKDEPLYQQIEGQLRRWIRDGTLKVGDVIPPSRTLARVWKTNYFTIHTALSALAKDGLIQRVPKKGTVVLHQGVRITHAAIYFGKNFWNEKEMGFYQGLYRHLARYLGERNIWSSLWVEPEASLNKSLPISPIQEAAKRWEIQCVIAVLTGADDMEWIGQLPVPTVFLVTGGVPNRVSCDFAHMAESSVRTLADKGCRSIGLISHIYGEGERAISENDAAEFYNAFWREARRLGLKVKKSWVVSPAAPPDLMESYGYEEFRRIWAQSEKPDGMIVFPDVIGRGVVHAVQELGVRVPRDLKLVLHRTREVEFFCAMDVDWMEFEFDEIVEALLSSIERQMEGNPPEPVFLKCRIIKNKTTN